MGAHDNWAEGKMYCFRKLSRTTMHGVGRTANSNACSNQVDKINEGHIKWCGILGHELVCARVLAQGTVLLAKQNRSTSYSQPQAASCTTSGNQGHHLEFHCNRVVARASTRQQVRTEESG